MPGDVARLPVTCSPIAGEAIDGYLERLAAANGMERPRLTRRLRAGARATFLTTAPDTQLIANLAVLSATASEALAAGTLSALPGIDTSGLDPADRTTWRTIAARGWPPEQGTALCPLCLTEDGIWRLAWRHPWVTACTVHRAWLVGTCPMCGRRFRSHRTPLLPLEAPNGTCGNPTGVRGKNCPQNLFDVSAAPAPAAVTRVQQRIDSALTGSAVDIIGSPEDPATFLTELKALAVLLLHLAIQPGGEELAGWAAQARTDTRRSAGVRGPRWGLAPPHDLTLRGHALAAADTILSQSSLEAADSALHPWTELTPRHPDGQLGWLAAHTTMTSTLTRLVMSATASRRRIATLLRHAPGRRLPPAAIPQLLSVALYREHLADMLDVTDPTGRLYASLCLARRHATAATWAAAAEVLGLSANVAVKTARACGGDLWVRPDVFVAALDVVAARLDPAADFRTREDAVRRLARRQRWYRHWARTHLPGSHSTSQSYAITWLWTEYAFGRLDASPGWSSPPDAVGRARYRRYAGRLTPSAQAALVELVR